MVKIERWSDIQIEIKISKITYFDIKFENFEKNKNKNTFIKIPDNLKVNNIQRITCPNTRFNTQRKNQNSRKEFLRIRR